LWNFKVCGPGVVVLAPECNKNGDECFNDEVSPFERLRTTNKIGNKFILIFTTN